MFTCECSEWLCSRCCSRFLSPAFIWGLLMWCKIVVFYHKCSAICLFAQSFFPPFPIGFFHFIPLKQQIAIAEIEQICDSEPNKNFRRHQSEWCTRLKIWIKIRQLSENDSKYQSSYFHYNGIYFENNICMLMENLQNIFWARLSHMWIIRNILVKAWIIIVINAGFKRQY